MRRWREKVSAASGHAVARTRTPGTIARGQGAADAEQRGHGDCAGCTSMTLATRFMEDSHEQRASEYASGRRTPPPYDPKMQWRVYREQQRAAWRAQRDAWRAQRHAWKANYVGAYGPRVPSVVGPVILICVGVIALLVVTGHIDAELLLVLVRALVAAAADRGGSGAAGRVGAGHAAADSCAPQRQLCGDPVSGCVSGPLRGGMEPHLRPVHGNWNGDDDDFFNFFGHARARLDQPADIEHDSGERDRFRFDNPRGDVSITASDEPNLAGAGARIGLRQLRLGAKNIFDSEAAHVTVSGTAVVCKSRWQRPRAGEPDRDGSANGAR